MKRRFLALVAVGIVSISMTWLVTNSSPQRRPPPTNGPAVLAVRRQITSANELTAVQREGLTRTLALRSTTSELTNVFMIEITNRGSGTVEMWGYDSASPIYYIYVNGTNGLERLASDFPNPVPATIYLGPTQSLTFPVVPPVTDRPWHVSVSYKDSVPPSAFVPFTPKAPTPFDRLVVRGRELVPFLRTPQPGSSYYTISESIIAPGSPNKTLETNRR